MIYIDPAIWKKKNGRKFYCHLAADSIEELHEFAKLMNLGKHFFHAGNHIHYDLAEEHRSKAIENGAKEITSKELAVISRKK